MDVKLYGLMNKMIYQVQENQIKSKYKNEIGNKCIEIYYKLSEDKSSIIESDNEYIGLV